MKNEILQKPNQTIMITNKDEISLTQRKVYNIILFEARRELLKNNAQNYFYFSIADLKKRAGVKATDNWHLKKDLEKLSDIKVEIIKDKKDDWGFFRLLSSAEKEGDLLKIELPGKIKESLINNDYYTPLDLFIIKKLNKKYSVILYEMALRYKKTEIPKLTIEEFKKMTGTETYMNFSDLKKRVIKPAIDEITEKTDIILSYTCEKFGKKVISIKFEIESKKQEQENNKIYSESVEKLFSMLPEMEQLESRKSDLEKLLQEHTGKYLAADIKYCNKQKPKNYWAYFLKSTQEGHFSKNDIEKEEKKAAKQKSLFDSQADQKQPEIEKVVEIGKSNIEKIKESLKKKSN